MGFEEFTEHVSETVRVKAGGAYQIKRHDVTKNNQTQPRFPVDFKVRCTAKTCVRTTWARENPDNT